MAATKPRSRAALPRPFGKRICAIANWRRWTCFKRPIPKTNLPAQIEIYAAQGDAYKFMFMAKGGGSANKSLLFQETKALLNPERLRDFIDQRLRELGTAACPPYHLALVIGGTSAEYTLKTAKLASARYLDTLPTQGDEYGRAFRDLDLEKQVLEMSHQLGIGAQFGGKYFCHDVRVIRLPRHGASCPWALPYRALRTDRSWRRSRARASFSKPWKAIRQSTCPKLTKQPWAAMWSKSISTNPWTRCAKPSANTRSARACPFRDR